MIRIFALAMLAVVLLGACAATAPARESTDSKQLANVTVYKSPT